MGEYLYNLVMDYFDNLSFIHWASHSEYTIWADRVFTGYYTLQYLKTGVITLQIDDNPEYTLTGPTAWFTFPGLRFRFGSISGDLWNHKYVAFSGKRAGRLAQSGLLPVNSLFPAVKLLDDKDFDRDFTKLLSILDEGNVSDNRALHLLEGILLQLYNTSQTPVSETSIRNEINRIACEISEDPERNWKFRHEAEKQNLSYDYFRHQFKTCLGLSPGHYLMNRRLQKGGLLLRTTDLPVKQIASAVGLDDLYYFSRQFKKQFRLPPGRYRKEFRT